MSIKEIWNKYVKVNKCETIEEAQKQVKDRRNIFLLGVAVVVVAAVLGLISDIFMDILMLPIMILCTTGIITWTFALMERNRLKLVLCPKCGKKFELENVSYEYLRDRESSRSPDKNGIIKYKVVSEYEFHCTCGNCGEQASFITSFDKTRGTKDRYGNIKIQSHYDIEDKITKFFS